MAEHPNVGLMRRGYDAFAKGDMATLRELFADNIVWHAPGTGPLSGDYKGRDAVFAFFARIAEMSGGTFRIELHDVLANDEHAVALARLTASRQGKQLAANEADVFHIRNGKVTEFWPMAEDQGAFDEFFS